MPFPTTNHYAPDAAKVAEAVAYFEARADAKALVSALDGFRAAPSHIAAATVIDAYFAIHRVGDLASLRMATSAFASKRSTLMIVRSALRDEAQLRAIAARSYAHPAGFDKLVFHHHPAGHKLRLHIYWRTPQELANEHIHPHRFEMASSPITGELTNHLYAVQRFDGTHPMREDHGTGSEQHLAAFTGYERDLDGVLHRRFVGNATLRSKGAMTFVPGQTYAQALHHSHYVETNAETGHTNGDVCSTIFVHGPFETTFNASLRELGVRIRATGSAALAIAKVAGQGNGAAIVTANDYDVAAALLIAKEAGAVSSTHDFVPAERAFRAYLVAQSRTLHDALCAALCTVVAP